MYSFKIGNYNFELLQCVTDDPLYVKFGEKPYYLSIRNKSGTPLSSTILTHRFTDESEARIFCQDVASGNISIESLMTEERLAFEEWQINRHDLAKQSFEAFINAAKNLGITPEQVTALFAEYDRLPREAREMVHDPKVMDRFKAAESAPADKRITFGQWMEVSKTDIDVCLVDRDTGEHYLDCVCYLSAENLKDDGYSPLEEWLFTLPVERVVKIGGVDLMVVQTQYSCDQTDFLLSHSEDGFQSQEWADLFDRAYYADTEFSQRLAYLKDGTPFELPFDGSCMDAVSPDERKELCSFLSAHDNALILPVEDENVFMVYSLEWTKDGTLDRDISSVLIRQTEPGHGLISTLEGKMFLAEQKAKQGKAPSAAHAEHNNPRI